MRDGHALPRRRLSRPAGDTHLVRPAARTGHAPQADGAVAQFPVDDAADVDFTAITRRGDGTVVLGSADGAVYTLGGDTAVLYFRSDDLGNFRYWSGLSKQMLPYIFKYAARRTGSA